MDQWAFHVFKSLRLVRAVGDHPSYDLTESRKRSSLLSRAIGLFVTLTALLLAVQLGFTRTEQGSSGKVRFVMRIDPSIDPFVGSGNPYYEQWIRTHWWRMMVYSTWFDNKTRWYSGGLLYKDCSGIYPAQQDVL